MKRNVSVLCVCSAPNILISGKIIKEMPGAVASGTICISVYMQSFFTTVELDNIIVTTEALSEVKVCQWHNKVSI